MNGGFSPTKGLIMFYKNSVSAMFNYFANNCVDYHWEYGLAELEALEVHCTTEALQAWHDVLVDTFYQLHKDTEGAWDYVIIE